MKTYIPFFLIALVAVSSCRALKVSDLRPEQQNQELLPNLEPMIHVNSVKQAYNTGNEYIQFFNTFSGNEPELGIVPVERPAGTLDLFNTDQVQDALLLFERDVEQNICLNTGPYAGYIVLKIPVALSQKKAEFLFYCPNLFTLGLSSLLGLPIFFYQTELELEVEILNPDKELIATYTGYGKGKVPSALYWGYRISYLYIIGNEPGVRKANIDAFKMAMNEVKNKIEADHGRLVESLN